MNSKKVFIVIINFNTWPDTKECLASLNLVDYDNFEVILIDNASKEKPEISTLGALKFKIQMIFNDDNLGFAGANNQGTKIALDNGADYVLLLNNDTTVEPDFLTKIAEVAQDDESAGIVGPLINFYDERNKIWSAGGKISYNFMRGELVGYGQTDEGDYQHAEQVDYISGTCLLIKKEVIDKIGLLSEEYFLYYEDTDWCVRTRQAGWRNLLAPQARIYHKASRSTQEFSYPYIYYHSRNGLMFASHFGPKILIYFLSVWVAAKQIGKFVFGYRRAWARPVLRAVWDFWRSKTGKLEGYY